MPSGIDEQRHGRYYLRSRHVGGMTDFWGHVRRELRIDFQEGKRWRTDDGVLCEKFAADYFVAVGSRSGSDGVFDFMKKLLIAIDYDGTYTEDPKLWDAFIALATRAGHRVICCTMRYEDTEGDEVKDLLRGKVERIFFTGRKNKSEALGTHELVPDIWIDDAPHWIFVNSD